MGYGRAQSERAQSEGSRKALRALVFSLVMLISGFAGIGSVPIVSATASGDMNMSEGIYPIPNSNYSQWDAFYPQVLVENVGTTTAAPRAIKWTTCAGDHVADRCAGGTDKKTGIGTSPSLGAGQTALIVFENNFEYYDKPGLYTISFIFVEDDLNPSNDAVSYTFTLAEFFKDIDIDEDWDVRPGHHNYAMSEGEYVYNTNTSYPLYFRGIVTSCVGCSFDANVGWVLLDGNGTELDNSTIVISNPGGEWGPQGFNISLPDLIFDSEGTFTLEYGVFSSTDDLNDFNDLASTTVTFNDTVDLIVNQMYPAYFFDSSNYFYGEDSVEVVITNNGNMSVYNTSVVMEIFNIWDEFENGPFTCGNVSIHPGDSFKCRFSLYELGSKKLRITIPVSFDNKNDAKPSDNVLTEIVDIISGSISPSATQGTTAHVYDTREEIMLISQVASTAARPLNFTWYLAGIIPWGEEQVISFNASDIGMGDHMFMIKVEDALGNVASAYTYLTIYNNTALIDDPWVEGEAVTRTHATLQSSQNLPMLGVNYNLPAGIDALVVMELDVISTEEGKTDPEMDWMDLDLNLSTLIPSTIDRNTLQLYRLAGIDSSVWSPLSEESIFSVVDNESAELHAEEGGVFLLAGNLPDIEVSPGNVSIELEPDGYMSLHWEPSGDLDNPYNGGWRIYQERMPVSTNLPFPLIEEVTSYSLWELIVAGRQVGEVGAHEETWFDPVALDTGICVSYLVIPIDRQGVPDYTRGNVSGIEYVGFVPDSTLICGDAISPTTEVMNLSHHVTFTNDTECWSWHLDWNRCYTVNVTWDWPSDNLGDTKTFNLYRLEQRPNQVDLRLLTPLIDNMSVVDGERMSFEELGWMPDGPRPYHTYYYVLAPVDEVGNVLLVHSYGVSNGNIERVYVEDQYWDYRSYHIPEPPPEPEPPLGIEYLGSVEEYFEKETFQVAGVAFLILLCMNLIGLPLLRRRVKRFKIIIAKKKEAGSDELDDDMSAFFD